jgi:hypothetical protein
LLSKFGISTTDNNYPKPNFRRQYWTPDDAELELGNMPASIGNESTVEGGPLSPTEARRLERQERIAKNGGVGTFITEENSEDEEMGITKTTELRRWSGDDLAEVS